MVDREAYQICRYYPDCEIHLGNLPESPVHAEGAPLMMTGLTTRQREALELIAEGLGDREMAERWSVSIITVRRHVEDLRVKLGARNRAHAVAIGYGVTRERVGHGG